MEFARGNVGTVDLVDAQGRSTGVRPVADAHRAPGVLHRAFSVLLLRDGNEMLLQRRSVAKERWPGFWSNSCCGHPRSADTLVDDAKRRVFEELGIRVDALEHAGSFVYRATLREWTEHEYDHVLIGNMAGEDSLLRPDPKEIGELLWLPVQDSLEALRQVTPWLPLVLEQVRARLA
ncbi:isopentenyl-diphosphate Delta-isomerase [Segniliparus rotundus]|nr:isopentenyl-diphosphate Delta-isomerase [Segniliparus rotundus]